MMTNPKTRIMIAHRKLGQRKEMEMSNSTSLTPLSAGHARNICPRSGRTTLAPGLGESPTAERVSSKAK